MAWLAVLQVSAAEAQGNIDAGKTPAQIFGDTCSACHRSARDLRRTSASFLRAHYTAGADEANAMANYLAGLGSSEPRATSQPKRPPADIAKQPPRQPAEQSKSAQGQPKGRPNANAQARAVAEERPPPEPPAPPPPPAPVLEPFEE